MQRTQDTFRVKRHGGAIVNMVKERYIRSDIPCRSLFCSECPKDANLPMLPDDATHYLIPDFQVTKIFLDVLETDAIKGIIFIQTVVNYIQFNCGRRLYTKLRSLLKSPAKRSVVFSNEFHQECYVKRKKDESIKQWQYRSLFTAAEWLNSHLSGKVSFIILTEDQEFIDLYGDQTIGLFVLRLREYLQMFWPSLTGPLELYESLSDSVKDMEAAGTGKRLRDYTEYLPTAVLLAGLKSGKFLKGILRVNKHNSSKEALLHVSSTSTTLKSLEISEVLIPGQANRNRAIHTDSVVVELLPRDQWISKTNTLAVENEKTEDEHNDGRDAAMPTGCVVGILQRNSREYVACIPEDNQRSSRDISEKILVIPFDRRIPKIRISTRRAEELKNQRIVVRIDSWEVDSFYPNGHFVKAIGPIGSLETEIKAILSEHDLDFGSSFSQGIQQEMPENSAENPFKMEETELQYRRDLRGDHYLIFSIDPVGCEDVDDTLSIRKLKNGKIELGVHIADVTHFVKPSSLTDVEAAKRSSTVYLVDRRYDMLPAILSSDLCSLLSGVDRYAVSVIWKFDSNYNVLDVWYGRTIIRSSYKLFYQAAQSIADGVISVENVTDHVPEMAELDPTTRKEKFEKLREAILMLMDITRHLKKMRSASGAVDLDSLEVNIEARDGSVKQLSRKKALEVHETVAECMIFANEWVARKIEAVFPNNALLRCHPAPSQRMFSDLRECTAAKGFKIDTSSNKALAASLDECIDPMDSDFNKILRNVAVKAMPVASYFSTGSEDKENFYHYGLALERYTHFTSPIRRYADIVVHRALLMAVSPERCSYDLPRNEDLNELCQHINIIHREAQDAQKDSVLLFQAMYFNEHNDDESCLAVAIIFKLKSNGVLVTIPRFGVKGAVFLKNKDGLVATPTWDDRIEFGPGSLVKTTDGLIINHDCGETVIRLLDKILVRITPNIQRTHPPSLNLEPISLNVSAPSGEAQGSSSMNLERKEMVKRVKAGDEEKGLRQKDAKHQMTETDLDLQRKFGQTHPDLSLYRMFQNFRKTALLAE